MGVFPKEWVCFVGICFRVYPEERARNGSVFRVLEWFPETQIRSIPSDFEGSMFGELCGGRDWRIIFHDLVFLVWFHWVVVPPIIYILWFHFVSNF